MVTAILHQPFGSACGSADAYGLNPFHPSHVDFLRALYLMAVGIDTTALIEKNLSVAALSTTDKQDEVVL